MNRRSLVAISLVAVLLAGSIVYPGSFGNPHGERLSSTYAIAHEGTAYYDTHLDRYDDLADASPTAVTDLGTDERNLFDTVYADNRDDVYANDTVASDPVDVCEWWVVGCTGSYQPEYPGAVDTTMDSKQERTSALVEQGDDRYVVTLDHTTGGFGGFLNSAIITVLKALAFAPLALTLAVTALGSRPATSRMWRVGTGFGAFLVAIGIVIPHVAMYTAVDRILVLLALTVVSLVVTTLVWRSRSTQNPSSVDS